MKTNITTVTKYHIVPCQYCHEPVERNVSIKTTARCSACKKRIQNEASALRKYVHHKTDNSAFWEEAKLRAGRAAASKTKV